MNTDQGKPSTEEHGLTWTAMDSHGQGGGECTVAFPEFRSSYTVETEMRNWQWNREAGLLYPRGRHGARKGEGTARTGGDCAARKKADGRQSFRLRFARETRDADRHATFVHLTLWT